MAMIGLRVPVEAARRLALVDVPGEHDDLGNAHITMHYLGDNLEPHLLGKILTTLAPIAIETKPIRCVVKETMCFTPDKDKPTPIVCKVISPDLCALKARLDVVLDKAGIDYSKKFPKYQPHTTLAYASEAIEPIRFEPIEWVAYELVLWGGDTRDSGILVTLPFRFQSKLASRVVSRYLGRCLEQ